MCRSPLSRFPSISRDWVGCICSSRFIFLFRLGRKKQAAEHLRLLLLLRREEEQVDAGSLAQGRDGFAVFECRTQGMGFICFACHGYFLSHDATVPLLRTAPTTTQSGTVKELFQESVGKGGDNMLKPQFVAAMQTIAVAKYPKVIWFYFFDFNL